MSRNVEANGLQDRIVVHAKALAGETGTFTFVDSGTASGHNGLTAPEGLGSEVTVPSETFDNAVKAAGGNVQIVKMDVEGAEYDILLRSDPASWTDVRKVVMEYHPVDGPQPRRAPGVLRLAWASSRPSTSPAPVPGWASCGWTGSPRDQAADQRLPSRGMTDQQSTPVVTDQTLANRLRERAKLMVRGALHRADLDVSRHPYSGRLARSLNSLGIDTILDIGANVGQYGLMTRRAGFDGTGDQLRAAHRRLPRAEQAGVAP